MATLLAIFGLVCFSYGAIGLVFLAFAPDLAASRVFGRMLTGKLDPTPRNKAMMLLSALFAGAYLTFFALRDYVPGTMAVVCLVAVMVAVAREQGRAHAARESGDGTPGTRPH